MQVLWGKHVKIRGCLIVFPNPSILSFKRVCPTRVSAHPSAQQLRPQRLKQLNPLLPFILMKKLGCLCPIFFSCHRSCGVLHGSWFMTGLPQELGQSFFCKFISTVSKMSSWTSPNNFCKVRLINVLFLRHMEQTPNI